MLRISRNIRRLEYYRQLGRRIAALTSRELGGEIALPEAALAGRVTRADFKDPARKERIRPPDGNLRFETEMKGT